MTSQNPENPRQLAEVIHDNTKPQIMALHTPSEIEQPQALLIPKSMQALAVKDITDRYKVRPDRRKGTVRADEINSFIELVNRFKSEDTVIFADQGAYIGSEHNRALPSPGSSITGIIDYHPLGSDNKAADNCEFKVKYSFPLSQDIKRWMASDGASFSQLDFSRFLEDRVLDIAVPTDEDRELVENLKPYFADSLQILELARDLEIYSKETIKQKGRLSSGETEVRFSTEHTDGSGKPIRIPDFFVINVPIFAGDALTRVLVRLRYRLKDGSVLWSYELYRIEEEMEEQFRAVCDLVMTQTELPLYYGAAAS